MQTRDLPIFSSLIAAIGELYGKAISAPLTDIYWQALKSFEWQDVNRGFQAHIHNPDVGQYFPKPADIIRFIEGSGETKALKAWTNVEHAIHRVGKYESLAFDDPIIHAVLEEMGGWVKLCSTVCDEICFRAIEFQKRYMGFVLRKPSRYPKYLCGITESENAKNGYDIKPPVLVGDIQKAQQVMLAGGGTPVAIHASSESLASLIQKFQLKND